MQEIDETTERANRGAAALRGDAPLATGDAPRDVPVHLGHSAEFTTQMRGHAQRAMEFGSDSLHFTEKVRLAYWNAFQHDCLTTAKATAYSGIFAIFPALGVLASLVALLPYTAPLRLQLAMFFDGVLPASFTPLVDRYFITLHATTESNTVLLGALLTSVVGAAGVLGTLMEGFRRAYSLSEECWGPGWRGQVRKQLQSFLLVPIALVPLAVTSVLVVFGHWLLLGLVHRAPTQWDADFYQVANAVRWIASLATTVAVLAMIYRFAVPVKPGWRQVWPGATFATTTWFVTTVAFGYYVTHFANYSRVYGSLGTGVVLLLWLFLTALSVLCGAELNAELGRERVILIDRGEPTLVATHAAADGVAASR